ncbi:MAG: GTPase Era [Burkholderiaceae bacterium]|nr:GTPase Era [Burkholderiaceae bacterium]
MSDLAAGSTDRDAAPAQRCGLVAIVGRPNVGKSTLLNALVGQKISITSRKAQTTRHRITGIRTLGSSQFVFVDTPGFQTREIRGRTALNRNLNRTVTAVLGDVDVVLFMVEAGRFSLDDAKVLALLPPDKPTFLVANKLDAVARRTDMLPWLKSMQERHPFTEFVPMSATRPADVERLFEIVEPYLPEQPWMYEEDALTDRSDRFLAAELIREKLFRLTGDELPYGATVVIDKYEEEGETDDPLAAASQRPSSGGSKAASGGRARPLRRIAATIVVERDAHKGMVIGEGGERLKRVGSETRVELEKLTGCKVFLELWVKVRSGWADSEEHLRSYGYE